MKYSRLGSIAGVLAAVGILLVLRPAESTADPGWKLNLPWGNCAIDCTPNPEVGFHCDCYELPPIIVEG